MIKIEDLESQIDIYNYVEKYVETYNEEHPELEEKMDIKRVNDSTYRVNPCPICGHKDHFTIYPATNSYSSFNKDCCTGGSILKFMQEVEGLELREAVRRLYEITGNAYETESLDEGNTAQTPKEKTEYLKVQKKNFILDGIKNQTPEQKEVMYEYIASRGISRKTADRYNLFVSPSVYEDKSLGTEGTLRLVVPIITGKGLFTEYSYVARAISDGFEGEKVLNNAGGNSSLNIDYVSERPKFEENKTIYVCEGWADALSIEDVGNKAIAIHSSSNAKKFVDEIKQRISTAKNYTYILCFDNDEAGKEATDATIAQLKDLGIKSLKLSIPANYNDVNEWYKDSPDTFRLGLDPFSADNMAIYMDTKFINDILEYDTMCSVTTGFNKLDEKLGGFSGLVVIGGGSSMGKTTLVHQICDNLAERGRKIIYFSQEQGKLELVSKSISRIEAIQNKENMIVAESGMDIMKNPEPISTKKSVRDNAISEYKKFANNILIAEGTPKTNIDSLKTYIEHYISTTGCHPVIVVDYLQMLSSTNPNDSDKRQIDTNMTTLRQMCRDYKVVIIAISSFNRENYSNIVDYKSFKESGSIEYTADIVLGLQLEAVNHLDGKGENEKRTVMNNAKSGSIREVELVCLKNRNAQPVFSCLFNYYPRVNYFVETKKKEDKF